MRIDFHASAMILAGLIHVLIAIFLVWKAPKDRLCLVFAVFNIFAALLLIGDALVYLSPNAAVAVSRALIFELGINFSITSLLLFIILFAEQEKRFAFGRASAVFALIVGGSLFIFDRSSFANQQAHPYLNGYYLSAIPSQHILSILYAFCFLSAIYILSHAYRLTTGQRRKQYNILFAGIIIGVAFFMTYFAAPNGIKIEPLGYIGSLILSGCISYAILRYQLMDIDIIIKKTLVYSMVTAVLAGAYVSLIFAAQQLLHITRFGGIGSILVTVFAVIVIAIVFEPLRSLIQQFVDKVFFKKRYEYQEAIKRFSGMVVTILDLDQLLHRTATTIKDILQLEKVVVFLQDAETNTYELAAFAGGDENEMKDWRYAGDGDMVTKLKESGERILKNIDDDESGVVLALRIQAELIGFIVLGEKLSGDIYTPNDIALLTTLADQLSIAVENARLYRAAVTDKLTKLFNGTYFYDRLDEELERSRSLKSVMSIILFDIDGFTEFSKKHGAGVSNQVLATVGSQVSTASRAFDLPARIGDDEFALMMPGVDRENAKFMAGVVQNQIAGAVIDGEGGSISVSYGIAYTDQGAKSARRLLNEARISLMQNKELAMLRRRQTGRS